MKEFLLKANTWDKIDEGLREDVLDSIVERQLEFDRRDGKELSREKVRAFFIQVIKSGFLKVRIQYDDESFDWHLEEMIKARIYKSLVKSAAKYIGVTPEEFLESMK